VPGSACGWSWRPWFVLEGLGAGSDDAARAGLEFVVETRPRGHGGLRATGGKHSRAGAGFGRPTLHGGGNPMAPMTGYAKEEERRLVSSGRMGNAIEYRREEWAGPFGVVSRVAAFAAGGDVVLVPGGGRDGRRASPLELPGVAGAGGDDRAG